MTGDHRGDCGGNRFQLSGEDEQAWCQVEPSGDCVVVTIGGEIDRRTVPGLRDALRVAAEFSPWIVVDLCEVSLLDADGLQALMEARQQARRQHGTIVLSGAWPPVPSAAESAHLKSVFAIYDRVDDALAALSAYPSD